MTDSVINKPGTTYLGTTKDGRYNVFMRPDGQSWIEEDKSEQVVPKGSLSAPLQGVVEMPEQVGPIAPLQGVVEMPEEVVPAGTLEANPPMPVEEPQQDTRSGVQKALDDIQHGAGVMASGLIDVGVFPSKLLAPVEKAFVGTDYLDSYNKRVDAFRKTLTGKSDKDYNTVENMLHFGGQLVPTPGMAASAGKGAVTIGQKLFEAVTPLLPSKGLTTTQMAANVAVPTAIVEGIDAVKDKLSAPASVDPAQRALDVQQWMKDNQETLLAAPLALATRGKYRKALGITGKPVADVATAAQKAESALFDSNAKLTDRLSAAQTERIQSTIPASAMASRTLHAFKAGLMPSSSVRLSHVPSGMLQAWAKMPDQTRMLTNTALRAADDLDNRALGGQTIFPGKTDAELRDMVRQARLDPVAARWMSAYKQNMQDVLRYMRERGLLTEEKYTELLTNQPNYVSRVAAEIPQGGVSGVAKRAVDALLTSEKQMDVAEQIVQQMMQRGPRGTNTYETLADAAVSMEQTIQNVIRFAEVNAIRRNVLPTLSRQHIPGGGRLAERVKTQAESNISVLRDGKREYWHVNDPGIAQAVQFAPLYANVMLNNTRHWYQMATTGPVADAITTAFTGMPLQSIANAFYESMGIMTMAYKGSKFNPLDAILAMPTGVAMSVKARYYELLARGAEEAMLLGTPIARVMSPDAARNAADAYARTIVGTLERHGGALTAGTTTKEYELLSTLSKHYAPTHYGNVENSAMPDAVRSLVNNWYWAHDSVQMLWKYHYMYRNMPANATASEEQHIANMVARVTGDFRQKGDPTKALTIVRDSQPYANVSLQSMYAFFRAMKNNPGRLATAFSSVALAGAGMMTWQMLDNPQLAQFYWNELSPEQRAQGIPLWQDPSNPRAVQFIMLPHEPRPLFAAWVEAFGTMSGFKDGSIYSNPDKMLALSRAFDKPWMQEDTTELGAGVKGAIGQIVGDVPIGGGIPGMLLGATGMQWRGDKGLIPSPESNQSIEKGKEFSNDPHDRWTYDIVRNGLGMVGALGVAMDRGFNAVGDNASMWERTVNAWEHGEEVVKPRAQKLTGLLGADHRVTTINTTYRTLQPKAEKIDTITRVVSALNTGGTNTDPGAKGDALTAPKDLKLTPEAIQVSQAVPPAMWKQWRDAKTMRGRAYEQRDALQNSASANPEEKTRLTNEYNRAINSANAQLLLIANDMERFVGKRIGNPSFRFEDLRVSQ